ncbi:MAG: hypothetical protein ABW184_06730, partial [Sphingobium sp.]
MAVYFFHMHTDTRSTDAEGTEFAHPLEARAQAIATCGQMMKEAPETFWGSRPWSVVVTNAAGLILWEISMDGFAAPAT